MSDPVRWCIGFIGWLTMIALFLTGCAFHIDGITLRNQTGELVKCPGFAMLTPNQSHIALELQRGCVRDYQRQGFERIDGDERVMDASGKKVR